MAFELKQSTAAKLRSVTLRTEKHGEDDVSAISLGFKLTGPNTLLDLFDVKLRHALYMAVPDQEQLPGVEPSTPLLRTRAIEQITLKACFEGWTLHVEHGINDTDPITLGAAKCDNFKLTLHEGGSIDLYFRVGSNDVSATEMGLLGSKLAQEVHISLLAPVKSETLIDGTGEQFKKDHPLAAAGQADLLDDPTGTFVAQHGDRGDDEGSPRTSDDAGGDGSDSEGGETDVGAGDGLAEFEAGATAAVESAGLKKKRGPAANDGNRKKRA